MLLPGPGASWRAGHQRRADRGRRGWPSSAPRRGLRPGGRGRRHPSGRAVTNIPDATSLATAELTLSLMLCLNRRVAELDRRMRAEGPTPLWHGATWATA